MRPCIFGVTESSQYRLTLWQAQLAGQNRVTTANLMDHLAAERSKTINLIIKADVQGSVETLVNSVTGMNTNEVKVRVIHSGVGPISESDVELAIATNYGVAVASITVLALLLFHVAAPGEAITTTITTRG